MNAKPIIDALAALKAVSELPAGSIVSSSLWSKVMQAEVRLDAALQAAGLIVEVEKEEA